MNAVDVVGLEKRFGDVRALAGISFSVRPGTIFALLGRNGSGKTTTVRILSTLTGPTAGRARVAGFDVVTAPQRVRRRIGVTMQAAALDPEMTGREHLELVCGAWSGDRATARVQAAALLADFGLHGAADRVVATYSGGMRRRLDIAGALANRPTVLFLDEPTTGLDAQSRRALWQRVGDLRDGGTAILLTTQYLEEADALADELAILDAGTIVAEGTPASVKRRHSKAVLRARVTGSAQDGPLARATATPGGWLRLELPSTDDALAVIDEARGAGTVFVDVAITPPTLEDAFLTVTGSAVERAEPLATGAIR